MKNFKKIHLLDAYLAKYYSIDFGVSRELGLGREYSRVLFFHEEEEWRLLDDQGKSELFKTSLSFNRKTGPDGNYTYAKSLVAFFDELLLGLNKVNRLVESFSDIVDIDFDVLRIYSVLTIEKGYFDELPLPRRHLEPSLFENLADQFSTKYPELNLVGIAEMYKKMYDAWPEKPPDLEK